MVTLLSVAVPAVLNPCANSKLHRPRPCRPLSGVSVEVGYQRRVGGAGEGDPQIVGAHLRSQPGDIIGCQTRVSRCGPSSRSRRSRRRSSVSPIFKPIGVVYLDVDVVVGVGCQRRIGAAGHGEGVVAVGAERRGVSRVYRGVAAGSPAYVGADGDGHLGSEETPVSMSNQVHGDAAQRRRDGGAEPLREITAVYLFAPSRCRPSRSGWTPASPCLARSAATSGVLHRCDCDKGN